MYYIAQEVRHSCSPQGDPAGRTMKPTILCFSHLCNQAYITGAEKHLLFMIRELASQFTCILVVPQEGLLSQEASASGIAYNVQPCQLHGEIVDPFPGIADHLNQAKKPSEWDRLIRFMRKLKPDYVLVNTSVHVWPAMAAKSLGIPTLWQITECIADNGYAHLSADIIARHADAVIGNSNAVLSVFSPQRQSSSLPSRFRLPPSWHMEELEPELWNVYRDTLRKQLRVEDSEYVIGYIASSISAAKGLEHFIDMALSVAEQHTHTQFLIVGEPVDSTYMKHCQRLIDQSSYASRFHYIRFVPHIQTVYTGMDIVVVPSLIPEGFGMTAMEGLLFGKGVLTYRSGGLGEIMDAIGSSSYAVETGDCAALVRHIDHWLAHPKRLVEEQQHNKRAVIHAFGIHTYRERLHRLWTDWIREQGQLFSAVQGNDSKIYIRLNDVYHFVANKKALKSFGITAVRRIPHEVLMALPLGEPIVSRAPKYLKSIGRKQSSAQALKRKRTESQASRKLNQTKGSKLRNGIKKTAYRFSIQTGRVRFRKTRGTRRRQARRYRRRNASTGSCRRSTRQFSSRIHMR